MKNYKPKKIVLSGGGSGGPVTPLLVLHEKIISLQNDYDFKIEFLWVGTRNGIEKEMIKKIGIDYKSISSGKLRRYFSFKNFIDPFKIIIGFFESCFFILKAKPDIVISAGGFVSVPLVWAAWLFGVKTLIHQQDIRPGLANKLMAPFANIITVSFEKSLKDYGKKAKWIGNPVRVSFSKEEGENNDFSFKNKLPILLVSGGGTGSVFINKIIIRNLDKFKNICNIIHITGKGKKEAGFKNNDYYRAFEFLELKKMQRALRLADVVITRAGLGTLSELSFLAKPIIIIPMPGTHQEDNADVFKINEAAIVLGQEKLKDSELIKNVYDILNNKILRNKLSENIRKVIKVGADKKMAEIIIELINKN
jgi:UDP-N-acetylglucosamine--N-acetylmuramyl-(pentapeptide) pyrophosphoryl-undecaprenol N-acetylglucosamine transferase